MMPVAGRLSDTLGRKRVFLVCTGLFTLGSLLCGLAPSIGWLIAFRVLQAIGGGGLMPSAVGIISDQFGNRRAQARGLFSSILPIGAIVGPNLGGFLLHAWSWRALFFVNVPLGVVVLIGVYCLLHDEHAHRRDYTWISRASALFAGAVLVLMYGMTALGNDRGLVRSPCCGPCSWVAAYWSSCSSATFAPSPSRWSAMSCWLVIRSWPSISTTSFTGRLPSASPPSSRTMRWCSTA